MIKSNRSVPISAFSQNTRFAINPERISDPGCIEVHLVNYDYTYENRHTPAGGLGLVVQGTIEEIRDSSHLRGRYALIAGFDEVFEIAGHYDGVVILRPLGVGLGVRWEEFKRFSSQTSRKTRVRKKHQKRAAKALAGARHSVAKLTGTLEGADHTAATGPYILSETTLTAAQDAKQFTSEVAVSALTMQEARQLAQTRVAKLTAQGWTCGEQGCVMDTIEPATPSTVRWLCQKRKNSKWVIVGIGRPKPMDPDEARWAERRNGHCSVEDVVEMMTTWHNYPGFSGEHCHRCLAEANVLAGPGWFCGCGSYNNQCWSNHQIPHQSPDYGPTLAVLRAARKRVG